MCVMTIGSCVIRNSRLTGPVLAAITRPMQMIVQGNYGPNTPKETMDLDYHRAWISRLLTDYYDPMYDYQLQKKQARVVCSGTAEDLSDYLVEQGLQVA